MKKGVEPLGFADFMIAFAFTIAALLLFGVGLSFFSQAQQLSVSGQVKQHHVDSLLTEFLKSPGVKDAFVQSLLEGECVLYNSYDSSAVISGASCKHLIDTANYLLRDAARLGDGWKLSWEFSDGHDPRRGVNRIVTHFIGLYVVENAPRPPVFVTRQINLPVDSSRYLIITFSVEDALL